MHVSQQDLSRSTRHGRDTASMVFTALNNDGQGFDPSEIIDSGAASLLRRAENTSDVSVFEHTDEDGDRWILLVGTDGTGSDDSRWAVRVGDVGVDLD